MNKSNRVKNAVGKWSVLLVLLVITAVSSAQTQRAPASRPAAPSKPAPAAPRAAQHAAPKPAPHAAPHAAAPQRSAGTANARRPAAPQTAKTTAKKTATNPKPATASSAKPSAGRAVGSSVHPAAAYNRQSSGGNSTSRATSGANANNTGQAGANRGANGASANNGAGSNNGAGGNNGAGDGPSYAATPAGAMNFVVGALTGDGGVPAPSVIAVLEATYGGNCGARRDNTSNFLRASCNGLQRCAYTILAANIGDPVFGCKKDYVAAYTCSGDPQVRTVSAAPEAGWGSSVVLDCTY